MYRFHKMMLLFTISFMILGVLGCASEIKTARFYDSSELSEDQVVKLKIYGAGATVYEIDGKKLELREGIEGVLFGRRPVIRIALLEPGHHEIRVWRHRSEYSQEVYWEAIIEFEAELGKTYYVKGQNVVELPESSN